MRTSVRRAFVPFTSVFEGVVAWPYLDIKGLVTIAIGNLIDPIETALGLPFVIGDYQATQQEIADGWHEIKGRHELAQQGHLAARKFTKLRLTAEGIETLVYAKLDEMWAHLAKRFPAIEEWPADAQLGVLSMSWAMGPNFRFPAFEHAVNRLDFTEAVLTCGMDDRHNPGLTPRNAANRQLFANAADVIADGLDPDVLHYPDDPRARITERDAGAVLPETEPELPVDIPITQHLDDIAAAAVVAHQNEEDEPT